LDSLFIFYLTNKCNFRCKYCYESLDQKRINVTKEDIITYLDEKLKNASDQVQFVLFGGEPFLEFEKMRFFCNYALKKYKNVRFTTFTNGSFFQKNENILEFIKLKNISVYVSYDGVGNNLRVDRRGDTTSRTIKVLGKLSQLGRRKLIDWGISYTINTENHKLLYKDLENILESFHPPKIILNTDYQNMAKIYGNDPDVIRSKINSLQDLGALWEKYKIPLCNYTCDLCNKCKARSLYDYTLKDQHIVLDANKYHHKEQVLV
jgi:sulfatase maturation enzyme AslB (radical SAM superfamily)